MTRPLCTCGHAIAQHELAHVVDGRWSTHVDQETGELRSDAGKCSACGACEAYTTEKPAKLKGRALAVLAMRLELAGLEVDVDARREPTRTHLGPLPRELLLDPVQRAALLQPEHLERMLARGWRPAELELGAAPPGHRYAGGVVEPLEPPAQAGFFDDLL